MQHSETVVGHTISGKMQWLVGSRRIAVVPLEGHKGSDIRDMYRNSGVSIGAALAPRHLHGGFVHWRVLQE